MSTENNISFNNEVKFKIRSRSILGAPEIPTMIRVLVKKGLVKNEKQAIAVLMTAVVLFISFTVFLIGTSVSVPTAVVGSELLQ
jgi:hypothetical protein